VRSAKELGHAGKPDGFHAALAFRERRFLLTRNAKDYLDHRALPFNRTYGVIAVEADLADESACVACLAWIRNFIVPFGSEYVGGKFRLSATTTERHFIDSAGRLTLLRYERDANEVYGWIDDPSSASARLP
jgi:hypothetical protein